MLIRKNNNSSVLTLSWMAFLMSSSSRRSLSAAATAASCSLRRRAKSIISSSVMSESSSYVVTMPSGQGFSSFHQESYLTTIDIQLSWIYFWHYSNSTSSTVCPQKLGKHLKVNAFTCLLWYFIFFLLIRAVMYLWVWIRHPSLFYVFLLMLTAQAPMGAHPGSKNKLIAVFFADGFNTLSHLATYEQSRVLRTT